MLLYHGSNQTVEKPRLIEQTRGLDFGMGFYLTTKESQASEFSKYVTHRRSQGVSTVSMYEFDMQEAKNSLDIATFAEPDAEWLEYVKDNRLKIYNGKQYDVIVGPVANDRVFLTLQAFLLGQFNVEATLAALEPYKLYDQYCFATEKALSMLKFASSMIAGGK